MSTVEITLMKRVNGDLETLGDLAAPNQEMNRVDFLQSLLRSDGRSASELHSVLDHLCRRERAIFDSEKLDDDKIVNILTLEPKTVLVLDPAGLRASYSLWASLYRESLTIICRDSWQDVDLPQNKGPVITKETGQILARGANGRAEYHSLYQGCFDLVLGFHDGATNMSKDVLPLLSADGVYLEIFIDSFHSSEIATIYSRKELEEVARHF